MDQRELLRQRVRELRTASNRSWMLDQKPSVRSTGRLRGRRTSR